MARTARENWTTYPQLVLTMLIWGVAWPVGRLLATDLPPISVAAVRYIVVVPILFLILRLREGGVGVRREWTIPLVLLGLFSTTLYQAFFLFGVKYAAASDDSLVIGVGPVIIALLASLFAQEPLSRPKVLGFLLGLSGVGVISLLSPNTDVLNRPLGIALVFGGAISYALYTILLRRFLNKNSLEKPTGNTRASTLSIETWMSFFGFLLLVPFSLLEAPWAYSWNLNSWLGILYLAIFSTIVGFFFYIEGVSKIGASRAAIFGNLVPVFGVLSSFLILRESVSIWHAVSFTLIFAGVYVVNSKTLRGRTVREAEPV